MFLETTVARSPGNEGDKGDQSRHDGPILSSKPWAPLPKFDSLDDFSRNSSQEQSTKRRATKGLRRSEITYSSDGIQEGGKLIKPKVPGNQKWPAIIFNRGRTGDYSRITDARSFRPGVGQKGGDSINSSFATMRRLAGYQNGRAFHGAKPDDWPWSNFRHFATGLEGTVEIESFWTAWRRE